LRLGPFLLLRPFLPYRAYLLHHPYLPSWMPCPFHLHLRLPYLPFLMCPCDVSLCTVLRKDVNLLLGNTLLLILIDPLYSQLKVVKKLEVADLGEITLDPVPVGLLLGQSSPVLVLELLLSENKNNSSGSDHLFCLLHVLAPSFPTKAS
jgi:hypothetical protein